ncbi:MAG: DUF362 domain-containing protein [Chloroflexi bacterium]|nr:DUF362 domain-containing protein [Chloroflexota bacterium]
MLVLDDIYPEGITVPDFFFGKNIVHLPTVKCVSGDTEVVLADGSVATIRDVVTQQMACAPHVLIDQEGDSRAAGEVELLAMGSDGRVRPYSARWFWRTSVRGRRVLRLHTRTGRTLTATADHRIHTPGGWTAVGELAAGARVAIARRLRVAGSAQSLPGATTVAEAMAVVARPGRRYSARFSRDVIDTYQAGATTTLIAERAGIPWQSVQQILNRHGVPLRGNTVQVRTPERTSPALWRLLGYVMAEGCVERGPSTDKLWWVNSEPAIRDEFKQLTQELFGLQPREHSNGKHLYIYGKQLGRFFESLGLPIPLKAHNKQVPAVLFRCADEEIAAFLSGYLDGDGCVSSKQAEINVTTKSPRLAQDLLTLFARLGAVAVCRPVQHTIPGKWTESRTYYLVSVSGEGIVPLADRLQPRHPAKRQALQQRALRFLDGKQPSNWDVVPVPADKFQAIRQGLGLTQAATGRPWSVNSIEQGYAWPTPRGARYFVNVFEQHDLAGGFSAEIADLRAISNEDLAWDVVERVEEVPADEIDLFDVTVPDASSFIANGLVVHNCHIYTTTTGAMKNAFGGLLNTKRHYTHSWIHQTLVDLLAIQKEIHSGLFATMDGTTAGNGPGPRTMRPEIKNVILASADQVAIDAVGAKLMGFDPLTIDYIRLAHQQGLGCGDVREIEVVGADVGEVSWGFSVGDNGASRVGDLVWFGPLKPLQNLFMRTPLVNLFILGSETYHDYYRWPVKDRRTFEAWRRNTTWGRLFSEYLSGSAILGAGAAPAGAVEKSA